MKKLIRKIRTQRIINKVKKINERHDKKLASAKYDEYFIFPNYSDDFHNANQKGIANVFTLRCLNNGLYIDEKVRVITKDGEVISEDALIVKNNCLKKLFESTILEYVRFMNIKKCYYYNKEYGRVFEIENGKIDELKQIAEIQLDNSQREFCYGTSYMLLGYVCSTVPGFNMFLNNLKSLELVCPKC